MSELTRIINAEITIIENKRKHDSKEVFSNNVKDIIKSSLDADDIQIKNVKDFDTSKKR